MFETIERPISDGSVATQSSHYPDYNSIMTEFRKYSEELEALYNRMATFGRSLLGVQVVTRPDPGYEHNVKNEALNALLSKAEKTFAAPGTTLNLNKNQIVRAVHPDFDSRHFKEDFDLNAIWAYCEKTYGGETGERLTYQQKADKIINLFWLGSDREETKETSKYVAWGMYVYCEPMFRGSGFRVVAGSSDPRSFSVAEALYAFAIWTGDHEIIRDMEKVKMKFLDWRLEFQLGERFETKSLTVVFRKKKWEFQFPHSVMEKMKLFLGEFASEKSYG